MPLLLRSEEHTSELQSPCNLVCRLLLEKKKKKQNHYRHVPTSRQARSRILVCAASRHRVHGAHCGSLSRSSRWSGFLFFFFFFNDPAPTEIYPLSLHDALPI